MMVTMVKAEGRDVLTLNKGSSHHNQNSCLQQNFPQKLFQHVRQVNGSPSASFFSTSK